MPEQLELPIFRDPEHEGVPLSPGTFIRRELEKRNWSQSALAEILGKPLAAVNEVIKGKRAVTPEMAVALGNAFGQQPALWMHREAAYRMSLFSQSADGDTVKKAQLHECASVRDKPFLDQIVNAYQQANGHEPFSRSEAAAWAIQRRLWDPPMKTKVQLLNDELAAAMGTARANINGRKVRHYHCVQQQLDDGTQQTLWCHVDIATPEFLEQSLARRRRSLRNQNIQLHNDVAHINQLKGMNIQLLFDYSDDIADYEHELGKGGDTSDQDDLTDPEH